MKYIYNDDKRNELRNEKLYDGWSTPEAAIADYKGILEEDKKTLKELKTLVDRIKSDCSKFWDRHNGWDLSDISRAAQECYEGSKETIRYDEQQLKDAKRRFNVR